MATIGRGAAVGDVFGLKIRGWFGWLFWIFLHIFWLIGFRNRVAVMTEWAYAYVTFQRRIRLITGEKLWPSPEAGPPASWIPDARAPSAVQLAPGGFGTPSIAGRMLLPPHAFS